MDYGKIHNLMDMDKLFIIMEIFIKANSIIVKDKDMVHTFLIKFINMKVNGKIIILMVKEKYIEINNYFFKDSFKMA
jgi:hypothetical protein